MSKRAYKTAAIVCGAISAIGLISCIGKVKPVNIGAFVFPLLIAIYLYTRYRKAD